MTGAMQEVLAGIATVRDMVAAFEDEDRCRRLLEAMVWAKGRNCPACGHKRSTTITGRDAGGRSRPGLYQCSNGHCRLQFTVTTRTPLHSTKLPLRVWLTGLWLILQADKGISSVRLAEALGVSQPTGLAHRSCPAATDDPRAAVRRYRRDRRILYRRQPAKRR